MNVLDTKQITNKVLSAWADHKDRTGMSQLKGAQALGMGQSAFSQYLRGKEGGGIPPNHSFILKFATLVGTSPRDLGWADENVIVRTQFIPVLYTFCGKAIKGNKLAVSSTVVAENIFAIENNGTGPTSLDSSEYLLASTNDTIRSGDLVWLVRNANNTMLTLYGRVFKDMKWDVVSIFDGIKIHAEELLKGDKVYRITGSYIPPRQTEIFTKG